SESGSQVRSCHGLQPRLPAGGELCIGGGGGEPLRGGGDGSDVDGALDREQRVVGDVVGEQVHSGQAAGRFEGGQRGRQRQARGGAHGGRQSRGAHHRQADVLGDPQRRPPPAEGLHLDHHHVGGLGAGHGVGVGGASDGLVGGDRYLGGPA